MSLRKGRTTDTNLHAAWQELAAQAAQQAAEDKPWLLKLLAQRGATLAARYALWKQRLGGLRQGERRRLQRRLGVGLAGAALLLALGGGPAAHAGAPIVVDGVTCTLIDAITSANTDSAVGGCTTGYAGADAIDLQTDVLLTSTNNSTYGPTGLPVVLSEITIEGNGHTILRDSSVNTESFRILAVGGGTLNLNNATISSGISPGVTAGLGGGIFARSAMLSVSNSTFSGNSADRAGGGIAALSSTLTVVASTITGNTAAPGGGGGGLYTFSGAITVHSSTISGNSAPLGGGAVFLGSSVALYQSVVDGNSAYVAGGIVAAYSPFVMFDCTIKDNVALGTVTTMNSTVRDDSAGTKLSDLSGDQAGGQENKVSGLSGAVERWRDRAAGVQASSPTQIALGVGGGMVAVGAYGFILGSTLSGNSATRGGGIFADYALAIVVNTTLSGNTADSSGGGIYNYGSTLELGNVSIVGNSAGLAGGGISSYDSTTTVALNSILPQGLELPERFQQEAVRMKRLFAGKASGSLTAQQTTSGVFALYNTLVSGNTATAGNEIYASSSYQSVYSVFGHDGETNAQAFTGFTLDSTDIDATSNGDSVALSNIVSATLADNDSTVLAGAPPGAIPQTLALPANSPAIDHAPTDFCTPGLFLLNEDQRHKPRNVDGDGAASSNECDSGAYELQTQPIPRIIVHKQTLPDGDATPFLFRLRGPAGRDFTLTDNQPHSTGLIPAGVYTLEEVIPPGWDPAIPLSSLTCDDGSPLNAVDLAADEVLVCRFLNYKRGNIVVKKVTLPPVAAPSFNMRLINNTSLAKTFFSLANGQQFDTGAITSVPTYKLLETVPGGWKRKNIVCSNGSPSTAIAVPPGGSVTCTVTNENTAPSNIVLSSTSVAENKAIGTLVGNLSATDAVAGDTHTFSFVNDGTPAAANNGNFQIVGAQLKTAKKFDFETKSSHNIKLQVTDSAGQTKVKAFVISIVDGPN